ncbi:jacalin-like lectin [Clostridioides difficile]
MKLEEMCSEYCEFKTFDDSQFAKNRNRVTKIILRGAFIVDAIQFVYDGKYKTQLHGEPFGGSIVSMDLDVDDYIIKISGSIGWFTGLPIPARTIGKITFLTKKGKTITAGEEKAFKKYGNFTLEPESGKQIFALQGSYSVYKFSSEYSKRYLDCLGIACMK